MITPTQLAHAVHRLAKAANPAVVPQVDYFFGATRPDPSTRPLRDQDETPDAYRDRLQAWREANPPVWEIQSWDEIKLGPRPTTTEVEAAVQPLISPIVLGEQWVTKQGFDADRKVTLLDMLLQAKEAGALAGKPKLVGVYQWMQTVKSLALAGQTEFPPAPFYFEEILQEVD